MNEVCETKDEMKLHFRDWLDENWSPYEQAAMLYSFGRYLWLRNQHEEYLNG